MRQISETPSVVPDSGDQTVYLVLDDFGDLGSAYRETDPDDCDLRSVVDDFLSGQFEDPVRIIAFNVIAGTSWDASREVALEFAKAAQQRGEQLSRVAGAFYERHTGTDILAGVPCR